MFILDLVLAYMKSSGGFFFKKKIKTYLARMYQLF